MQTNLSSKIIMKRGQTSLSGDSDTSKGAKPTKENEGIRKLKPSLIPRRKTNTCKVSTKETPVSLPRIFVKKPHIGHKNIQRVQHLNIDQDIYPGIHSPPKSVTTARPIPTLQHIYREDLSNETFTDWFLESVSEYRDIPEQFIDLNTASVETPKSEADSSITVSLAENNELNPLNNLPDIFNISPTVINYKSTNENVQDWLYSKLDYPTRDNESGYQSMSKPSQNNFSLKSKNSFSPKIFGDDKFYILQNTLESNLQKAVYEEINSDENVMEQPTVLMNKTKKDSFKMNNIYSTIINTDIKLVNRRTDIAKPIKYPSSPNPRRKLEHKENHPISSYVDYPSEILQKTTNFDANGCEIKNSGLGANSILQDDLSSQCTLDLGNVYNIPAENDSEWTKLQCSQHNTTVEKSSKISNFVDESWQFSFCEDKNDTNCFKNPNKNSYHDYYYHYCWRKEVAKKNKAVQELWDGKGRCKKCQKLRRSPYRKKLPRSLKNLKKRMSIGRICRRRWDCVWKKTAERWTNWSKSHYKFKKFQMINFKKPIKWDDADVQTTIYVYNETGTDAVTRKRKSPNITNALKNSLSQCEIVHFSDSLVTSAKSNISYLRHANVGPSIFRFSANPSILIGKSPNQSKMTSYKSLRCRCNSIDDTAKETIFSPCDNPDRKISDHIQDNIKVFENKITSAMFNLDSVKIDDSVTQDAYTQMIITCNNVETTTRFSPTLHTDFMKVQTSDNFDLSYGVDEGTQSLISNTKSQRSINVMTSKVNWRELINKEIQASPVSSIRRVSTGFVLQDRLLQDAKSSVVTDTSIPYRKLNATITTPKGTILSCTGTKITSVSSVQIQTASVISKHPKITSDIAVSTDVNTENRDCSTAPSLYLRHLEDVALGTDSSQINRSEKATSYAQFTDYISAGISTSNLVNQVSFNGEAYQTQGSFGAAFHPECSTICTNTDIELKAQSTKTDSSFELQFEPKHALNKNDCYAQYSISRKSNQLSNNSGHSARIGHSRLLSVRNLGGSLCESPQTQATSSFDRTIETTKEQSVSAAQFNSINELGIRRTSNVVQTTLDTGEKDELKPFMKEMTCKSKSKEDLSKIQQNLVISSNLNAAKWIKGCVTESRKNIQSVVNLSESTVKESLERASFAIINSRDKKVLNEMKNLSKVLINQRREINCVTAKPLGVVSTVSAMNICPTKDKTKPIEKPKITSEPSDCKRVTVDNITSGEIITNDITECIQVRPEVRDTATNYDQDKIYKSDFVITSNCLLPDVFTYYDRYKERNNKVAELLNTRTSRMTSCTLCAHAECCLRYNQPGIDTSIQAVAELLTCPNCSLRIADKLDDQDIIDDIKSHLASNCRYYRNMLAMKLALFKENFQKYETPSIEKTMYQAATIPNIFTEACTMKPSGRKDVNCQTKTSKNKTTKVNNNHSPSIHPSHLLSPAYSLIDIRGNQEKDDLKAVYNILTAIEGRVRRIKNNLRS